MEIEQAWGQCNCLKASHENMLPLLRGGGRVWAWLGSVQETPSPILGHLPQISKFSRGAWISGWGLSLTWGRSCLAPAGK